MFFTYEQIVKIIYPAETKVKNFLKFSEKLAKPPTFWGTPQGLPSYIL